MPKLSRIVVYPIKSLDGAEVEAAAFGSAGWLCDDRRYAIVDEDGGFLNGKRTPAIHTVRAVWTLHERMVALASAGGPPVRFCLETGLPAAAEFLSDHLGMACRLMENRDGGFPDDTDAPGPTLISAATLRVIAGWFPGWTLDDARRRLRTNLEIGAADPASDGTGDAEPMEEERLVTERGEPGRFRLGDRQWLATGICQRCVVPARDPETGEPTPGFQKAFARQREATLPAWSPRPRFNHFYRVAINTRLAPGESPGVLHAGDRLTADNW